MLDYKLEQNGTKVTFEILDMDERLRYIKSSDNSGKMIQFDDEENDLTVYIGSNIFGPKIDVGNYNRDEGKLNYAVYLRGSDKSLDNRISEFEFDSEEDAEKFISIISKYIDRYIDIYDRAFNQNINDTVENDDIDR